MGAVGAPLVTPLMLPQKRTWTPSPTSAGPGASGSAGSANAYTTGRTSMYAPAAYARTATNPAAYAAASAQPTGASAAEQMLLRSIGASSRAPPSSLGVRALVARPQTPLPCALASPCPLSLTFPPVFFRSLGWLDRAASQAGRTRGHVAPVRLAERGRLGHSHPALADRDGRRRYGHGPRDPFAPPCPAGPTTRPCHAGPLRAALPP